MNAVSTPSSEGASSLRAMRRALARRILVAVTLGVLLPTLAVVVFDLGIASKQYESVATFTVDTPDGAAPLATDPSTGASVPRDASILQRHVESRDMLERLVALHGFRAHYASPSHDRFSRLARSASAERTFAYYRDHVSLSFDEQRGFMKLTVRAYSGADAKRFADAILAESGTLLRRLVVERRTARITSVETESREAARRLDDASARATSLGASATPPSTAPAALRAGIDLADARAAYERSLRALEEARVVTAEQERRLVVMERPASPDTPSSPTPLHDALTTFFLTAALLVIGSILIATAKEHA